MKQQDILCFAGHAIEARLCSEDCGAGFHAAVRRHGALAGARWGVCVEHALQSGSKIPPFYDSTIAKVISHGATRDARR